MQQQLNDTLESREKNTEQKSNNNNDHRTIPGEEESAPMMVSR